MLKLFEKFLNNELLWMPTFAIMCILIGSLGYYVYDNQAKPFIQAQLADENSSDLETQVFLLTRNVSHWYYYNESNMNHKLTEKELVEHGGVCWHYSNWYADKLYDMGYNTEQVTIFINKTASHRFAVASSADGDICVIDQEGYYCWKVGM